MNALNAYLILLLAAVLEAGGDAFVRLGLQSRTGELRLGFCVVGATALFGYALAVNAPPWDFGRLLGVYVTLFFVVAQLLNLVVFGVRPSLPLVIGGGLIALGGAIITFWRP